ncbi:MAG: APC family permease [Candidatus Limnocylindria bacterium]
MRDQEPPDPSRAYDKTYRQGARPGDRTVRVVPTYKGKFTRQGRHLVATEASSRSATTSGRIAARVRRVLFGAPIATEREGHERLTKVKALAVFSSDAVSSSAYATEEIMRVLVLAGAGAIALTMPVSIGIGAVLAIVVVSYRQTIAAYPNGGGSYIVASANLGVLPGLVAAAALLTDYVLTVAVSVAAGVEALGSAFPEINDFRVFVGLAAIALLTIGNLRGIRESGNIFAAPTYVFIASLAGLIGFGIYRQVTGTLPPYVAPPQFLPDAVQPLGILLILRAFSSGAVALTGVEAISNGVPAFKPPEAPNARVTMGAMGLLLGALFLGVSYLVTHIGILPDPSEQQSVISQLSRALVGGNSPYYFVLQIATALILVLAANTSFADFPRLASILARDRFMPHQFAARGERLAFSSGIVVLALLAGVLLAHFAGSVAALIPLYAIGVFTAFTLSECGMVMHWWRRRGAHWRRSLVVNALGAVVTGITTLVIAVTKAPSGAWLVLVLIPAIVVVLYAIHRHYRRVEDALYVRDRPRLAALVPVVIVPVGQLDRATLRALSLARALAPTVIALHVASDPEEARKLEEQLQELDDDGIHPVVIESPYRAFGAPLLAYLDTLDREDPDRPITVVLSEYVPSHWWEYLLHNQHAMRLKLTLFFRPNTTVIDVPFRFDRD